VLGRGVRLGLHVLPAIVLTACGGIATSADSGLLDSTPGNMGSSDAADDARSALTACAFGCYRSLFALEQSSCPVLLLDSSCLDGKCDLAVSTTLCGGGDGHTPPDPGSVECAQKAFPRCPGVCAGEASCKQLVACILACR
jgi:hypothetical protein